MTRKPLTAISVSSMLDYLNCPLRWCYAWLDNRVPKRTPRALRIGTLVHEAFELHFNTGDPVGACLASILAKHNPTFYSDTERTDYAEAARLVEPLDHWTDLYPIDRTLEVEVPFEKLLPTGLTFVGRPDRVVVIHGRVYHFQHKTVGAAIDLGTYITAARHSLHELLYGWILADKYAHVAPYGGSFYNIIRKLKYRSQQKGARFGTVLHQPEEFFLQTSIAIDPTLQARAIDDLTAISAAMQQTRDLYLAQGRVPPNRNLDRGRYGSSLDPYLPVILGERSLDDPCWFTDRSDPYESEPKEDVE